MGSEQPALDREIVGELQALMGGDFGMLVNTFLTDSEQRIAAIEAALQQQDPEALRRAAHSFKGSAANLGAAGLSELCRQLEEYGRDGRVDAAQPLLPALQQEYSRARAQLETLLAAAG